MRLRKAFALSVALSAVSAPVADAAGQRIRRPNVPPPPAPVLPRAVAVDEFEFELKLSRLVVGAGQVRIRIYNRGEDDHNLVVRLADGSEGRIDLKPGGDGLLTPTLTPGTYELYCDLFAGSKDSHYEKGMRATIEVR